MDGLRVGSQLFDFAEQFWEDHDAGESHTLAEYLSRFPGAEEEVAREYLRLVAETRGLAPPELADATRIGPYRLLAELGRGGQGRVYLAADSATGERVALKVLDLSIGMQNEAGRARFRREAALLQKLAHPGICAVHRADLGADIAYIAMRYLEGETLARKIQRARSRSGPDGSGAATSALVRPTSAAAVEHFAKVFEKSARALHAAHEAGVVHRDVKPSNLWITDAGDPVLLDFGLAAGADDPSLTRSNDVFGTPAYMAPEQAEGRTAEIDARTDVYGLGATLYECLTLEPPFVAPTRAALLETILHGTLPDPRGKNPHVPDDLAIVVATALERDRDRRYATALDLAEDLRRVRVREPIRARKASSWLRLRRWSERHPTLAVAIALIFASLSTVLGVSLGLLSEVRAERDQKQIALEGFRAGFLRGLSQSALKTDVDRALALALQAHTSEPSAAGNATLLTALQAFGARRVIRLDSSPASIEVSADGAHLAACSYGDQLRVIEVASGHERWCADVAPVHALAFDAAGERLLVVDVGGGLRVVRARDGAIERQIDAPPGTVVAAALGPSGDSAVTLSSEGRLRMWDLARGFEVWSLALARDPQWSSVCYSPDGSRLAVVMGSFEWWRAEPAGERAVLIDVATGRIARSLGELGPWGKHAVYSPAGELLAVTTDNRADDSGTLEVFVGETGEHLDSKPLRGRGYRCAFSRDGLDLAVGFDERGVVFRDGAFVLDAATRAVICRLRGHEDRAVVDVAFSPRGDRVATAGFDATVRVWDARTGTQIAVLPSHSERLARVFWTPDGSSVIASGSMSSAIRISYAGFRPFLPVLTEHAAEIVKAAFDAPSSRLLSASRDGTARIWRVGSPDAPRVLDPQSGALCYADWIDHDARVVTVSESGDLSLWEAETGRRSRQSSVAAVRLTCAAVSADDRWVIGGSEEGACVLWDLAGEAAPQRVLAHQGRVYCAAFDAHGRRAITGAADGRAVLWDVPAMTAAVVLPGLPPHAARLKGVFGACFDPSGRFIALATSDHLVRILDARTGVERERFTVTSPMFLATDDAGRRLLIGHRWGSGLWCVDPNVASEPPIMKAHTSSITSVAASADGRFGLSTSLDRSACLWSLESEELLVAYTGHGSAVLCGAISPDARWAATGDGSGSIRLWPIDLASAASSALEAAMQASDR